MMKRNTLLLFCLISLGCNSKKLDLKDLKIAEKPNVDLSDFTRDIREQKGRYEAVTKYGPQLVDKGEKIVRYFFTGNTHIKFYGAKLADVLDTKVVTYNGILSFIAVHPDNRDAGNLLTTILKAYPAPDSVVYNQRSFTNDQKTAVMLKKLMPELAKDVMDELGNTVTQYPERILWCKNNILTELIMDPTDANLNLSVRLVTKQAYLDHVVLEYFKPLLADYDSPYKNLFKK